MRKAKDWERIIEDWRRSGLTQSAYCREKQLSLSSFNNRLRKQKPAHVEPRHFVELSTGEPEYVEILTNNRVVIRLPKDVSAARVSELVQCLT